MRKAVFLILLAVIAMTSCEPVRRELASAASEPSLQLDITLDMPSLDPEVVMFEEPIIVKR